MLTKLEDEFIRVYRSSPTYRQNVRAAYFDGLDVDAMTTAGLIDGVQFKPTHLLATADAIGYVPNVERNPCRELTIGPPTKPCDDCKGEGTKQLFTSRHECDTCKGSGKLTMSREVSAELRELVKRMPSPFVGYTATIVQRRFQPFDDGTQRQIYSTLHPEVVPRCAPYTARQIYDSHILLQECNALLDAKPVVREHLPNPNPPGSDDHD